MVAQGGVHHCCFALSTGALVYIARRRQRTYGQKARARASAPSSDNNARMAAMRKAMAARRRRFRDDATKVADGLYLGGIGAAQAPLAALRARGVTHILTVSATAGVRPGNEALQELQCMRVAVHDKAGEALTPHLERAFAFIDAARDGGGAVLVHCFQGKSRSVAVVLAYQMYDAARKGRKTCSDAEAAVMGLPFLQALDALRVIRPCANPNAGFAAELLALQRKLEDERCGRDAAGALAVSLA